MTTMTKKPRTAKKIIQVRVDAKTKDKADRLFKRHGLSTSDGVRRLIDSAIRDDDPWLAHKVSSHLPNAESLKAIEEALADGGEPVTWDELCKFLEEKCENSFGTHLSSVIGKK